MLVELSVRNLVIVESAVLTPGEGFTAISGETGAGKSLLLDALDLVSGARAQAQVVGPWGDSATVAAVFEVESARAVQIAEACGVPIGEGGQVILRRRIASAGRSQAWINDVPVSVAALRAASDRLIEYHAQHEPIRLADPAVQLDLLDRFAGLEARAVAYAAEHQRVLDQERALTGIDSGERESLREADYLRFQLGEFEALSPRRGELAELEQRHLVLSSAGELRDLAGEAVSELTDDDRAVVVRLGRLARRLGDAPDPRMAEAGALCLQAVEAVRDAAGRCSEAADGLRADPGEMARIGERIDAWHALARKHGDGEEALFLAWERVAERLRALEGLGERRAALVAELERSRARRVQLGTALADERVAGFARLAKAVHAHLAELGMAKARVEWRDEALPEPGPLGLRRQEFLVRTNPGMPPGSIRDIASGGEASRLMLALAAALGAADKVPVMVFDEVDSGVGGRLGAVIGAKLATLGTGRTVLAVTHTPQLAAAARRHYLVRKVQGDRDTRVVVEALAGDRRVQEVGEMLGGGAAALAQARVLMGGGVA